MVRPVERIEQNLARLDQAVAAIAQEFHDTYSQYLTAFGQAVRQQLILASYHLCTHGYPERFLNLSLSQRQQLQQSLRQLTKTAESKLLDRLQSIESSKAAHDSAPSGPIDELMDAGLERQFTIEEIAIGSMELTPEMFELLADASSAQPESTASDPTEQLQSDSSQSDLPQSDQQSDPVQSELDQELSQELSQEPSQSQETPQEPSQAERSLVPSEPRPTHPKDLVYWQEQIEEGIVEELQDLSHAANRLLQQAEILPSRLPEPVLEVAAKADIASESAVSPPNLLNLLIETEDEDEKESAMTQLMAIRLRLSEIEFSDSASSIWRSKIRDLSTRLNKLGREYQKTQKERSIAQAEAAWRSSWYED